MTVWLDAHLSPALAPWMEKTFGITVHALRDLGLRDAEDPDIFSAARTADAVLMTKDSDFADLVERFGPPPRVIWVRCGNTSNAAVRDLFSREWASLSGRLNAGEVVIEIGNNE